MSLLLRATQSLLLLAACVGAWSSWQGAGAESAEGSRDSRSGDEPAPEALADPSDGRRIAMEVPPADDPSPMVAMLDDRPRGVAATPAASVLELVAIPPAGFDGDAQAWSRGKELFEREWTDEAGLGTPHFNGTSCGECHRDPIVGGSGDVEFNVIQDPDESSVQRYLRRRTRTKGLDERMRERVIAGIRATREREQKKKARRKRNGEPPLGIQTPSLLGLGRIDSIPDEEILRRADPFDRDLDGIRGRAQRVAVELSDGELSDEIGRFGWRAEVPRLADFVGMALAGETGITAPDQGSGFGSSSDLDGVADPEVEQSELDALTLFVTNLPEPTRAGGAHRSEVQLGEILFRQIGCAKCHVPSLMDRHGDPVPLYSDLLVHRATSNPGDDRKKRASIELRTPPLWGIRDTAPYLHDGRAETLLEAVLAHDHEARVSREEFEELLEYDRNALLAFVADL